MTDLATICGQIGQCPGAPNNNRFKKHILDLLCCIAQNDQARPDPEFVCSSIDGRILVAQIDQNGVPTLLEVDGSPVIDGSVAVSCDVEFKTIETCYQDITDPTIRYTQLFCFEVKNPAAATTVWLNSLGVVIAPPVNIERCDALTQDVEVQLLCDDTLGTGANLVSFLRHYIREIDGTVTSSDTTLTGVVPYVVANEVNVQPCVTESSLSSLLLCDVVVGVPIQFVRHFVRNPEGVFIVVDTTLAGAPYVVTGSIQICVPPIPTLSESQTTFVNIVDTEILPANAARRGKSWVQNNTPTEIWLTHTGVAVIGQGVKLNINQIYEFNTTQQLRGIQDSGVNVVLDVVEGS